MSVVVRMSGGSGLVFVLAAVVACTPDLSPSERAAPSAPAPLPVVSAPPPAEAVPFAAAPEVDVQAVSTDLPLTPGAKTKLWRALQALPSKVGDFDDRGCAGMLEAKQTLGSALTALRRRHRSSRYYVESLSCRRAPSGDIGCDATLTVNGPNSEHDLGVSVHFQTDPQTRSILPPVLCFLAG